jgi:integrase
VNPDRRAPAREAAELIAGYRPPSLSEAAACFARLTAAACAPQTPARAKSLLFACGKLGAFASAAGLELVPEACLHPSVIERYIVTAGRELSAPTRRTLRTNLRYAARAAGPQLGPPPVPLPRQQAKAPYSAAEIAAYLALADAQPTRGRQMRASGLICLGAGAGLAGADLRHVRGSDITCRSGGVLVEVRGRRPRTVPVLSSYHEPLLASAG